MINILPQWLFDIISKNYLLDFVTELRIRLNKPLVICYKGRYEILQNKNSYDTINIYASKDLISYIITLATKQSFYAYNNQIKHGFITTDSGIRIGICGRVVYDKDEISTIKDISSLNIRISHAVNGCSEKILNLIYKNGQIKNTLIISPPGAGKTTFVRDLALSLSNKKKINNILIVDERYEIAGCSNELFNGEFVDIISGSQKFFAFHEGIKSMNPSVIVTDEISDQNDYFEIMEAVRCGVKVIATAHADSIESLKNKINLKKILDEKIFERIVLLSKRLGFGTIEAVFDENLKGIYLPIKI